MGYLVKIITGVDASAGGTTVSQVIESNSGITIQQVDSSTGTATLEVSSSGNVFTEYHPLTTEYDFNSPVNIQDGFFNWKYIRFVVQSGGSGTPVFEISARI